MGEQQQSAVHSAPPRRRWVQHQHPTAQMSSTAICNIIGISFENSLATSVMKPILTEELKRGLERGGGDGREDEASHAAEAAERRAVFDANDNDEGWA